MFHFHRKNLKIDSFLPPFAFVILWEKRVSEGERENMRAHRHERDKKRCGRETGSLKPRKLKCLVIK